MTKSKTGIYEWATTGINCTKGCLNACAFCYARKIAVLRGEVKSFKEFNERLTCCRNQKAELKLYDGVVMFPTMHDIFAENFSECKGTILNLLGAGNKVLITSKPRLHCMLQLFECLEEFKEQVIFRFTIGCDDDRLFKIWEPGAPKFEERLACLITGHALGYKTSVSMEPMLDPGNVVRVAKFLLPYTTDGDFGAIWIGKMNKIDERVGGVPREEINRIESVQSDTNIFWIYNQLKDIPGIQWKDSIKTVVGLK